MDNTINAIIIDDEAKAREILRDSLAIYCKNIDIIAEAESVKSGLMAIKNNPPDVVFLDVMMDDGTGFDLLEKLPGIAFEVIFVTAFDQYAVKAFEFSAVDYMLKPIKPQQLIRATGKLKQSSRIETLNRKLEVLISNMNQLEKIALPSLEGLCFVKIEEIVRCESDGNYTTFHMHSGKKIIVTKLIREYEEMLSPLTFFRIHKSHIINFKYIQKYKRGDGGSVIMTDGTRLVVSRRRKDGFMSALKIYS
ncbi:MAG: LytTR family DNA-binding domain-containing protein [Bacteroidales bacterium]|nr:LytTR family DNA-binding domain-containing protein [Bacteroidales bacterium]